MAMTFRGTCTKHILTQDVKIINIISKRKLVLNATVPSLSCMLQALTPPTMLFEAHTALAG